MPRIRSRVDEFIIDCEAIILLYRSGNLPGQYLEDRFNLAAAHWGVS